MAVKIGFGMMGEVNYYKRWYILTAVLGKPWIAAVKTLWHLQKFAEENHFDTIEIVWPYPFGRYDDFAGRKEFEEVIRSLMANFSVSVHGPMANLAAINQNLRLGNLIEVLECILYSQRMGAELNVVHLADKDSLSITPAIRNKIGKILQGKAHNIAPANPEQIAKMGLASANLLKERLNERADKLPKVGFENLSANVPVFHHPKSMKDLLDENYGLIIDTGHLAVNGLPVVPTLETWMDNTFEIHMNSSNGDEDDHCALGAGVVNIPDVIDCLNDGGYKGRVIAEISPRAVAPTLAYLRRQELI